jgi:hypothetical protein
MLCCFTHWQWWVAGPLQLCWWPESKGDLLVHNHKTGLLSSTCHRRVGARADMACNSLEGHFQKAGVD